jgi:hypothetical protein
MVVSTSYKSTTANGMTFTDDDKRAAAEREVKWRKRVYPRRVADRRMTQEQADREIAIMEAIAEDYRARSELPL